ncbi:hypothetical protein J1605_013528 [Eschrichtius robustus]|uniref:DUF4440 domain-containing protein n=1 Tax=Eschrichtius robustus TaxID=9764 RepID=A0AB34GFY4_ESCRO|nr:hypothetical protein J1605_013528 [Eschrichtius robustus]
MTESTKYERKNPVAEVHCSLQRLSAARDLELSDVFYFSKKGLEAIMEDEVSQRFSSEELVSRNLLTRTNVNFQTSVRGAHHGGVLGVIVRYRVLLPRRVTLAFTRISLSVYRKYPGWTVVRKQPQEPAE